MDTDASHAVPGPRVSQSGVASRRSFIGVALVAAAAAGVGVVHFTGIDHRAAATDGLASPNLTEPVAAAVVTPAAAAVAAPAAASVAAPAASPALMPVDVPGPARSASTVATGSRVPGSSPQASPTQAGRMGPAHPEEHATGTPAHPVIDAGAPNPSSAAATASAPPPKPKTPEGRLFEDVPF